MKASVKRKIPAQHQRAGSDLASSGNATSRENKGKGNGRIESTEADILQKEKVRYTHKSSVKNNTKGQKKSKSCDDFLFKKHHSKSRTLFQKILKILTEDTGNLAIGKTKISIKCFNRKLNSPNPSIDLTHYSSRTNQCATQSNLEALMNTVVNKASECNEIRNWKHGLSNKSVSSHRTSKITERLQGNMQHIDMNKYNIKGKTGNRNNISSAENAVAKESDMKRPNAYLKVPKIASPGFMSKSNRGNTDLSHKENEKEKAHPNKIRYQILISNRKKCKGNDPALGILTPQKATGESKKNSPQSSRDKTREAVDTTTVNKINSFPINYNHNHNHIYIYNQARPMTSLGNEYSNLVNKNFPVKKVPLGDIEMRSVSEQHTLEVVQSDNKSNKKAINLLLKSNFSKPCKSEMKTHLQLKEEPKTISARNAKEKKYLNENKNTVENTKQKSKVDIPSCKPRVGIMLESSQSNMDIDEYEMENNNRGKNQNQNQVNCNRASIHPAVTKPTFFESKFKKSILEKFFNFNPDEEMKPSVNKLIVRNNQVIIEEGDGKPVKKSQVIETKKKFVKRNPQKMQINNFQQIINNNLSFFSSYNTNSSKDNNVNKNANEYQTLNNDSSLNESSNYQSGSGKIIMNVSTGNINIINNINTHKESSQPAKRTILTINRPVSTSYPKVFSEMSKEQNNINDKTVVLDINSRPNTQSKFNQYMEALRTQQDKNSVGGMSEDDCTFSGDEKTEITCVPVFNSKKLECYNYNISQNNYLDTFASLQKPSKRTVNKFILEESFYTLFRHNTAIQECIVSYLSFPEIIRLSLTNRFLRKELKQKISAFVVNLILDESNHLLRLKIWRSIFHYSSLSKENYLKKLYLDHVFKRSTYEEQIKKDLTRTFPDDPSFKPGKPNYKKLFNILNAYSNYNLKIGYAQGLNFLVANALLVFTEEQEIFLFIDSLIKKFGMETIIGVENHMIRTKLEEIGSLFKKFTPDVVRFLESNALNHEFFTANWILTLFANTVKPQTLFYIWDFFFIYGWKFVNYFIVAIVIHYRKVILSTDPNSLSLKMKNLLKSDLFGKSLKESIETAFKLMS